MSDEFVTPVPPIEEPAKNNNTILIIIVIALLIFCCCCAIIAGSLSWVFGDLFLDEFNIQLSLLLI
jgi:hypothetical protein